MSLWVKINLIIQFMFYFLFAIFYFLEGNPILDPINLALFITFLIGSIIWVITWKIWFFFETEKRYTSQFTYYCTKNLLVYCIYLLSVWIVFNVASDLLELPI